MPSTKKESYLCTVVLVAGPDVTITGVKGDFFYSDGTQSPFATKPVRILPGRERSFDSDDSEGKYVIEFRFSVTCHAGSDPDQQLTYPAVKAAKGNCLRNKRNGEPYGYLIGPRTTTATAKRNAAKAARERTAVRLHVKAEKKGGTKKLETDG